MLMAMMVMAMSVIAACALRAADQAEQAEQAEQARSIELPDPLIERGAVHKNPSELARPEELTLAPGTYPRTDGSTSAEPLGVWVACRLCGTPCRWEAMDGLEMQLRPAARPDRTLLLRTFHQGTHGAYVALIQGEADLIYECRRPSADERKLMKEKGVELDIRPIALDAFVFLRHQDNPVEKLTLEQVRDIYTKGEGNEGRISNWKQVGGPDQKITAYVRNRDSGSQETMQTLVMPERQMIGGFSMISVATTMIGPYNVLHGDPNGIGYTFFYYQRHMSPRWVVDPRAHPDVRMFAIDGVAPGRETIADGSYPLVTEVYAVTRKDLAADHAAAKLRDWLLTEEGQKIISETGYVPISHRRGAEDQ
jgi:phosphate transport system substrate-binding protein